MTETTRYAYAIGSFADYFTKLVQQSPYQTQQAVADRLGISQRAVGNYLNGDRIPGIAMCELIAFAFGVSIAEVRAAAGRPLPTSIDSIFDKRIRSLMLGMDWTPRRLEQLTNFLAAMELEQEAKREDQGSNSTGGPTSGAGDESANPG